MKPALAVLLVLAAGPAAGDGGSPLNCPYPPEEEGRNVTYSSFSSPPKNLDPAVAYNADELGFMGQICEAPLQYHFLKRPYLLEPLLLEAVPEGCEEGGRVVYTCRVKKGIRFQDHPCFARRADGSPRWVPVDPEEAAGWATPMDFPEKGSRDLTADDCVHGIRRLANPMIQCPIRETLVKYLAGMEAYVAALQKDLDAERARRKAASGAAYNQALDERARPLALDLYRHPFPGVERLDRHTFRIVLKKPYPQILYWLAMPFFAPIPPEAEAFYGQACLAERNLSLNRFPVGTGPFVMARFEKNCVIELARNPNYRVDPYPSEGEPGDRAAGLLEDAGRPMPFIDRAVYTLEKEGIPRWQKFLQGYYDASGISSDSFERAVSLAEGGLDASGMMKEKGIGLVRTVSASTYYMGFNMDDPVVGGYDERRCKLRQAIGIAIDTEERIQIFANGRGIPAMSLLPPGFFGFVEGREGMDPYVYDWDENAGAPRRKPLGEAKRLLAEAGYEGGISPDGKQLTIGFDSPWKGAESQPLLQWVQERLKAIGVHLELRTTDYNRFQDKVHGGNYQMFPWGWNADYPDPENFFFLLYGPNSRSHNHGPNSANYARPEYDALFRRMENMPNSPERSALIRGMTAMLQHDAPWVGHYHPVDFTLFHGWRRNVKPNLMANNLLKYCRIDAEARSGRRRAWNRQIWWPLAAGAAALVAILLPAWLAMRAHTHAGGRAA